MLRSTIWRKEVPLGMTWVQLAVSTASFPANGCPKHAKTLGMLCSPCYDMLLLSHHLQLAFTKLTWKAII